MLNPRQARDFARAYNRFAKSDKIDAAMLAEFGRRMEPRLAAKVAPWVRTLAALVGRRQELSAMRTAQTNRLGQNFLSFVATQLKASIKRLTKDIKTLELEMDPLVESTPELKTKLQLLCALQGVGSLTALTLLGTMPELGSLESKQVANLWGVAPLNCDSGQWHGKRRIYGGRRFARTRDLHGLPERHAPQRDFKSLLGALGSSGQAQESRLGGPDAKAHHLSQSGS